MTSLKVSIRAVFVLLLALAFSAAAFEVPSNHIRLGHSGPLTGPLAELNGEYLAGARLHFDTVNRSGGIHGRTIDLVILDDAYDPERTEANVRTLIHEQAAFALFGIFGTAQNMRAIPVASEARVPYFAPYTGADVLRDPPNPHVFHLRASYGQEIEAIIDHLVTLGVTSIAVVHHADAFGQAGLSAAVKALEDRGRDAPAVVSPITIDGQDALDVAHRLAAANPAAVIMVMAGKSPPALIRALKATELRPMLYGLSVVSSRQLVRELGPDAHGVALAQVTPTPFRIDHAIVRDYRRLAQEVGAEYSYTALEGYLAARTLTEALQRSGADLSRAGLIRSLESLGGWDLGGLQVRFSPDRRVALDFVDLSIISHGRFSH